jgi:RNA polymerase sigma-70 factor, ECF subfamily
MLGPQVLALARVRPRAAHAEDGDARFLAAVREHERMLESIALRLCRDATNAKDLVQDTFERALRAWPRMPADTNVRAWLVTIQHRLFLDRCRRAKRVASVDIDQVAPPLPEPAAPPVWANVTREQLAGAIARLDDEFRRAYELHAVDGKSYREIAEELGIPATTVGTRLFRARKKLKDLLVAELGAEGSR